MIETKPVTPKELDEDFLFRLYLLAKTYGNRGNYDEVKNFVDFGFQVAKKQSPSDEEYTPFK